jgi:hypothetical protein
MHTPMTLTYFLTYLLGHNLNLGHSSEGTEKYGDGSGAMVRSMEK